MTAFVKSVCSRWYTPTPVLESKDQTKIADWYKVNLLKKDDNGQIIQDSNGNNRIYHYILNSSTGQLFGTGHHADSRGEVAKKSAALTLGVPFSFPTKVASHLFRVGYDISSSIHKGFNEWKEDIQDMGVVSSSGIFLFSVAKDIPVPVVRGVYQIFRSMILGSLLTLAAAYSTVSTYEGAYKWCGPIDLKWQGARSYKDQINWDAYKTFGKKIKALLSDKVVFFAYCMQPRGSLDEDRFIVIQG